MSNFSVCKLKLPLRACLILGLIGCIYGAITIFPLLADGGAGIIKIRNAFLVELGQPEDFSWTPGEIPVSFKQETLPPPPEMGQLIQPFNEQSGDSWDTTLAMARELLQYPRRSGNSIKSDTQTAYNLIVTEGRGYCADYSQVMNALALSMNIAVREWGFSDDAFGGGHAFNEVYSPEHNKWIFIDVFNAFYVADENGNPLSVLEFRDYLLNNKEQLIDLRVLVDSRFGFKDREQALGYYKAATGQFYMWWGNAIFSYEANAFVKWFSFSRHAEQLSAMLVGVHPVMRVVPMQVSEEDWHQTIEIKRAASIFSISLILFGCSVLVLFICFFRKRRS